MMRGQLPQLCPPAISLVKVQHMQHNAEVALVLQMSQHCNKMLCQLPDMEHCLRATQHHTAVPDHARDRWQQSHAISLDAVSAALPGEAARLVRALHSCSREPVRMCMALVRAQLAPQLPAGAAQDEAKTGELCVCSG